MALIIWAYGIWDMVIWAYGIWDMVIWAYGKRNCTLTRRSGEVGGLYYIMVTWAYGHADSHTDMVRHRIDSHMYVW